MADSTHFDAIVIGTGPGGEGAAMRLAKSGKTVAAAERFQAVGGGAIHWGTIPSKALRTAIYHMNRLHQNPLYHRLDVKPEVSLPALLEAARHVVNEQADLHESFYDSNVIALLCGSATFIDAHTIELTAPGVAAKRYTADGFVIAPGVTDAGRKPVSLDEHRAFRENLRAFKDRLREIGFYDDLSDAYNAQTIRPRYELRAEESAS